MLAFFSHSEPWWIPTVESRSLLLTQVWVGWRFGHLHLTEPKSLHLSFPPNYFPKLYPQNTQPLFSKQLRGGKKRENSFLPVSHSYFPCQADRWLNQISTVFSLLKALCTSFGTPWLIHFLPRGVNNKQKTHLRSLFQAYFPLSIN